MYILQVSTVVFFQHNVYSLCLRSLPAPSARDSGSRALLSQTALHRPRGPRVHEPHQTHRHDAPHRRQVTWVSKAVEIVWASLYLVYFTEYRQSSFHCTSQILWFLQVEGGWQPCFQQSVNTIFPTASACLHLYATFW